MEQKNEKKEYKYDYFVDKNNKMCPENSEFKPKKVDKVPSEPENKLTNSSAWNSVGTWEEKTYEVENFIIFIEKNTRFINRFAKF